MEKSEAVLYLSDFCARARKEFPALISSCALPELDLTCDMLVTQIVPKDNDEANLFSSMAIDEINEDGTQKFTVPIDGYYNPDENKILISSLHRSDEETRQAIRHEALHYLLFASNKPYQDDSPLFQLMALKYTAEPWALLEAEISSKDDFVKWIKDKNKELKGGQAYGNNCNS